VTFPYRRIVHLCTALAMLACATLLPVVTYAADADDPLVTLDAEDAYLPSVLKILAEKGNLNIITGPGVTGGRISIHMKDVPIEQAVNLVVRAAGLAYERIGRSILVADLRTLKEETGLSSYVVDLQYADAADVQAALVNLSAKISVDTGGNRQTVSSLLNQWEREGLLQRHGRRSLRVRSLAALAEYCPESVGQPTERPAPRG
jgi:type II secretory pathway component HofQ